MGRDSFFSHDAGLSTMSSLLHKKISHLNILTNTKGVDSEKYRLLVSTTRAGIKVLHQEKEKLWLLKLLQSTNEIKTIFEQAEDPSYKSVLLMRKIVDELEETGESFDESINRIMRDISNHIGVLVLLNLDNVSNIYGKVLKKTKSMFLDPESSINVWTQEQMVRGKDRTE